MDFRETARKLVDDISGIKTKEKQIDISNQFENVMNEEKSNKESDFELILEDLDIELNSNPTKYPTKEITLSTDGSVANSFKFLGKLSTAPNPMEYPENSLYKNINEGVVYINNGHLWEALISDGRQGAQGAAGGSGLGRIEAQTMIDNTVNNNFTTTVSPLVSSSINKIVDGRTFVTIGDSHLESSYSVDGTQSNNHCWLTHFMSETRYRYKHLKQLAVGGKRSDEVYSEQLDTAISYSPDFIIDSTVTNDVIQNRSIEQIIATKTQMYNQILASGIGLIIYVAQSYSGLNSTYSSILLAHREWAYNYAYGKANVMIFDGFKIAIDKTNTLCEPLSATHMRDLWHSSELGAYRQGVDFAKQINEYYGYNRDKVTPYCSPYATSTLTSASRDLFSKTMLTGSRPETNPGCSGTTPSGFYCQRTGSASVSSILSALSTNENAWVLYCSGGANADQINQNYGFGASDYALLSANKDRNVCLEITREMIGNSTGVTGENFAMTLGLSGIGSKTVVGTITYTTSGTKYDQTAKKVVIRTPNIFIPSGVITSGGAMYNSIRFEGSNGRATVAMYYPRIVDVS